MSDLDLDAIKARVDAATPGPWISGDRYRPGGLHPWEVVIGDYPVLEIEDSDQGRADAQFLAHTRDDVPALLAEVERLKANQMPDGGEWTWLYGFKASDGKFHTYGSATSPRRQSLYGNPLYRQRAFLCEVEPIAEVSP